MAFERILKELTDRSGASGAIMLANDGEVVAYHTDEAGLDIDLIGAHHGVILDIIRDASARSDFRDITSVSITTDTNRLAISTLKDGYYIVLSMDKTLPIGRALYESDRAARMLEEEMG
jgi:predicted regulator of Ras-like GTPase activity (Roadblock/LC7/MglB family)